MNRRELLFLSFASFSAPALKADDIDWAGLVVKAFEGTGSDIKDIQAKAATYPTVNDWRNASIADVSLAGGAACAVPGSGYVTLPAEFLYLMRQIYNSALGVGFKIYGTATKDDFANILAVWSDELALDLKTLESVYEFSEIVAAGIPADAPDGTIDAAIVTVNKKLKMGSVLTKTVTNPASLSNAAKMASGRIISKVLAEKGGSKIAGKLATKIAAKTGSKIGAKYATKAWLAWAPGVSGAACGGLNWWIMSSVLDSSELYFKRLKEFRDLRYKKAPKA